MIEETNELLKKLEEANAICQQSNAYYERAEKIRKEQKGIYSERQTKRILKVVILFSVLYVVGLILACLSVVFAGIVCFMLVVFVLYKFIQDKKDADRIYQKNMERSEKEILEGKKFMSENMECLSFLPPEYRYPMAIEYLINTLKTGRAKDLKEALDMYDLQLHRWKIEEANEEIVRQQKMQTANLDEIRRTSAVSAAANTVNAIFNISRRI